MTLNRRPIAGLAICFLAGSAVGSFLPGQAFLGVFFLSFVLVAVGVVCSSFRAVLFLATFTIGAANMVSTIPGVAPRDVQELFKPGDEHIALTGMISSEVVPRQSPYRNEIVYRIPVQLEGIRRLPFWQRARGTVWLFVTAPTREQALQYGQRIVVQGVLRDHGVARSEKYRYLLRAPAKSIHILEEEQGSRFFMACYTLRRHCGKILDRGLEQFPEHRGLLHALMLGYREALPEDWHTAFAETGTLHIFAISGLHVGVMAGLFIAGLRMVGFSRRAWILLLFPLLVIYVCCVGLKPSALRALVMALAFWLAPALGRKPDSVTALCLAASALVLCVPSQLTDPGFVFSFIIVSCLVAFYVRWSKPVRALLQPDPWALPVYRPGWGMLRKAGTYGLDLVVLSGIAWVASLPLAAQYF